ncbi:calcium-binding and coiled-coil domain-containing protein 1-like isoform X3 [Stigmatopora argus]
MGKVCAQSRSFTFCAPKPLDELETLREERDEKDEDDVEDEEELLLVVPRAHLLQHRLEECLREKAQLKRAVDEAKQEIEEEKRSNANAKEDWDRQKEALVEEVEDLRQILRHKCDALKTAEGKHKDVESSQENLNSELTHLMSEKVQSKQQIKHLLDEIKVLNDREKERNVELERQVFKTSNAYIKRLKEILMKLSSQIKQDEEKRKMLQAEHEATQADVRDLQSRLEASERLAEGLRRELRELGTRQGHAHAEMHQSRLQVAQLGLQLSEEKLLLREERANWALEREAFRSAARADKQKVDELRSEVRRKEERLQEETIKLEKLQAEFKRENDRMDQETDTNQLMLPGLVEPIFRELTGSIMW